jgi:hypothetical protein
LISAAEEEALLKLEKMQHHLNLVTAVMEQTTISLVRQSLTQAEELVEITQPKQQEPLG